MFPLVFRVVLSLVLSPQVEALAHALILMGECYEVLAEKESKNEARKSKGAGQIPGMPAEE